MREKLEILDRLKDFDEYAQNSLKEWKIPGMAISIVKDDEMIFSKGYGFRDPEKGLEMNADTLYRIASNTKAFVSMSLAILVDEGKLEWDKPVKTYIPDFQLQDTYATEHVTPRDLLCHRTGLPGHDGALHFDNLSRKELIDRFRYLEPSYPIRTKLQYNNWVYMLAGYLVESISGQKWECFVQERILKPLGMEKTNFNFYKSILTENFAECFYSNEDSVIQFKHYDSKDPEYVYPRAPAGAINSSANEMAKWMILQLNKGVYEGKRIVSESAVKEMHLPQMVDYWNPQYIEIGEAAGALGWFVLTYRGHKLVVHGGYFGSQVYLLPEHKIGITYMPTLGGTPQGDIILYNLIDRLLGLDELPWAERKREEFKKNAEKARLEKSKVVPDKKEGTQISHPLDDFCGQFEHPGYGNILIQKNAEGLVVHEKERDYVLRHYHYDTFEFLSEEGDVEFKVTFHTDEKGTISSASVPFEPSIRAIVFERKQ